MPKIGPQTVHVHMYIGFELFNLLYFLKVCCTSVHDILFFNNAKMKSFIFWFCELKADINIFVVHVTKLSYLCLEVEHCHPKHKTLTTPCCINVSTERLHSIIYNVS